MMLRAQTAFRAEQKRLSSQGEMGKPAGTLSSVGGE